MKQQNILLLGSGGRESALSWKLKQSPLCGKLYTAPGNAGTAQFGENLSLNPLDFEAVKATCLEKEISLLIPGSEDPLVAGITDFIKDDPALSHIIVAGPSKAGAQLEGSKAFSKKFMQRHHIPTAAYQEFDKGTYGAGATYLKSQPLPIVIKADGLAAGKGVVIAQSHEEALRCYMAMLHEGQFGAAGSRVVIESFLDGIELSVFVLTDGKNYVLLPAAKDYKRIGEGDKGPNTGGMGAISPVPFADETFMDKVVRKIIEPTVQGLAEENISYQGFIFFGLIKVGEEPFVIEYNCRMGDPETEVVLPRLENDLVELFLAMHTGKLNEVSIRHTPEAAATVMLVSKGYPGDYEKGKEIQGLDWVNGSTVFQAGTKATDGKVLTNGGRVLAITSLGETLREALAKSYGNAALIEYEGKTFRRDIGYEFL